MNAITNAAAVRDALGAMEFSEPEDCDAMVVDSQHPSYRVEVTGSRMPWGVQVTVTSTEVAYRGVNGWWVDPLNETPISVLEDLAGLPLPGLTVRSCGRCR